MKGCVLSPKPLELTPKLMEITPKAMELTPQAWEIEHKKGRKRLMVKKKDFNNKKKGLHFIPSLQ